MTTSATNRRAADRMAVAAQAFVASLDPVQRSSVRAPFGAADRRTFTYVPGPRPGLALADMTPVQREHAMGLLAAGLSERGFENARTIMELEEVLGEIERDAGKPRWERRQPQHYWFRVLGEPGGDAWAWKVGGHHLAVHLTVVAGQVAGTPQFFGANPARVPDGYSRAGLRTLPVEEDLARSLVTRLHPKVRDRAITAPLAPRDIITRDDPVADVDGIAAGVTAGHLDAATRDRLVRLIHRYLQRLVPDVAESAWAEIEDAGLDRVSFRWAGSTEPGQGHYYAVLGPTFLLEYDNVQNSANHVHTVWRDLRNDWGDDLLAAHHAAHRH